MVLRGGKKSALFCYCDLIGVARADIFGEVGWDGRQIDRGKL